jgi:dolichol-phosphate mannosyltransferase
VGDFRLIDKKVCDALSSLPEKNRYVRGLVSWVGFKQTYVEFVRQKRIAGETKYPLSKMVKLALDGITSLSYRPLFFINHIGIFLLIASMVSAIIIITKNIVNRVDVLSMGLVLSINSFMISLLFIALGIMGQYIGRIFDEVKDRPIYIIDNIVSYKNIDSKVQSYGR